MLIVEHYQHTIRLDNGTFLGEVKRHQLNILVASVLSDIDFSPIVQPENLHVFPGPEPAIKGVPKFGARMSGISAVIECAV